MVRRTRKRSKNKKGGADTSFTGKFLKGATDIGKGLQDARAGAAKQAKAAEEGWQAFNAARKAQYQSKVTATGGDGEKISLFEKKPQALLKPRRPVFPTQDPPTIIGGKRKTRRKKRRKNKKRKTKKRRRKRKTKRKRRR